MLFEMDTIALCELNVSVFLRKSIPFLSGFMGLMTVKIQKNENKVSSVILLSFINDTLRSFKLITNTF